MAIKRYINGGWTTVAGFTGPAGPPNTITIGTVVSGTTASATISGSAPTQVLSLVLPLNENAVTLDDIQTLTNKTITSPDINGGSLSSVSISDSILTLPTISDANLSDPTITGIASAEDINITGDLTASTASIGLITNVETEINAKINKSIVDAKGDLILGSGNDSVDRLAVGTDGYLLTADSNSTNGIKWSEAPGGLPSQTSNSGKLLTTNGTDASWSSTLSGGLNVSGTFTATTKSFDIQHPTNESMRLRYGSLEGPENGVYIRGKIQGNVIDLPDYWTGLVDEDSITVNLTSIGEIQNIYVETIKDNKIYIGGIVKNLFFTVYAERKDVDKLIVEY